MNDERLRALYAGAMQRMPAAPDATPVSLEAMVDVLDRRGSESERSQTISRIMRDPRSREEFELLRAISRAAEPPRASWKTAVAWRVAAGVAIMAGTAWLFSVNKDAVEPMRGGDSLMTTVAPADGAELTAPPLFVWQQIPGAVDYRIEVVDSAGKVVFEEQGADTSSTGPMNGELHAGQQYRWSVTALTKDARSLRSATRGFRFSAP